MARLEELYTVYGRLQLQQEALTEQLANVKKQIIGILQQQQEQIKKIETPKKDIEKNDSKRKN